MDDDQPAHAEEFRTDLLEWADQNLRDYSWREPDRTFYEVFVAEFFLTQTPADNVERVYPEFLRAFPDLSSLAQVDRSEIETAIESLGFQRMRSTALEEIAETYETLPSDPEKLQELPRVGSYVANATVCFALGRSLPVLDRNVVRVYDRVFGDAFPDSEREQVRFAEDLLPADGDLARTYNLALLDFGALVCTKLDPDCPTCFATDYCVYYDDRVTDDRG